MGSAYRRRPALFLRPAWPDEGPLLSRLAMNSKARWGYDEEFMARCEAELTVTPWRIASERFRVAQAGERIAGFSAVAMRDAKALVQDLFIDPEFVRLGVGHLLLRDLLDHARRHGVRLVHVEADPNAASFYEHEGFRRTGEVPSASIAGRNLPLMEMRFS
ncbi:GNAT family N-acetyltransferase [Parvibaculum sp.]|uniref:GNAT family N-acetyltransferase n=1 Tax=Parvibaculum sp. TaxID=2024848 RepID=UPI002C3751C2|nr:GNAT family N-acetyltransferase [Parvibaculum sp.]HUD52082.1 GNAT family N-acetyltransferase [Parvibaculum sp.]